MPQPPDVEAIMLDRLRTYAARHPQFRFMTSDLREIAALCRGAIPAPRPVEPHARTCGCRIRSAVQPTTAPRARTGGCPCGAPECSEAAIGWRFYAQRADRPGWRPVCGRHMLGAPAAVRLFDHDIEAGQ